MDTQTIIIIAVVGGTVLMCGLGAIFAWCCCGCCAKRDTSDKETEESEKPEVTVEFSSTYPRKSARNNANNAADLEAAQKADNKSVEPRKDSLHAYKDDPSTAANVSELKKRISSRFQLALDTTAGLDPHIQAKLDEKSSPRKSPSNANGNSNGNSTPPFSGSDKVMSPPRPETSQRGHKLSDLPAALKKEVLQQTLEINKNEQLMYKATTFVKPAGHRVRVNHSLTSPELFLVTPTKQLIGTKIVTHGKCDWLKVHPSMFPIDLVSKHNPALEGWTLVRDCRREFEVVYWERDETAAATTVAASSTPAPAAGR